MNDDQTQHNDPVDLTMFGPLPPLFSAISAAQAEIGGSVAKDSVNPHFKSRYASLAGVLADVLPILHKHGLALIQYPSGDLLVTVVAHKDGGYLRGTIPVRPKDPHNPQTVGSCLTYLRRYCVMAVVGVAPADEDDGETAARPQAQRPSPRPAPPPQPPAPANGAKALPASGQELQTRLASYEEGLVRRGVCQVGELLEHVRLAGAKDGHGDDLQAWTAPAIKLAVAEVKVFEEARSKPRKVNVEQVARLNNLLGTVGARWPQVAASLKLPAEKPIHELTVVEWNRACTSLMPTAKK